MAEAARICANCETENPAGSRFCNGCGAALEAASPPAAESRKTVTVLYCDAISSTALGERIDPESLRNLMTRCSDVMREVIMGRSDYLDHHGEILVHLARVLRQAGKADESVAAAREAVALYEQKGATFFVERTQRLIDDWTG